MVGVALDLLWKQSSNGHASRFWSLPQKAIHHLAPIKRNTCPVFISAVLEYVAPV